MRQYSKETSLRYENSVLKKYEDTFQPTSVKEVIFCQKEGLLIDKNEWMPMPWQRRLSLPAGDHQHSGPNTFGKKEFNRIINVYKQMKKVGYKPHRYKGGLVRGYFLKKNNDYRFIIVSGQHRMAALGGLGYKKV